MPKRPKIAALAPWAGGKRSIAHHIIGLLGEHTAYFEPFAGSMAVLMAKEPAAVELANDLDDDVVNVALCLQDRLMRRRLLYRLDNTLCHERLFAEAAHRMADPFSLKGLVDGAMYEDADRAYHALVYWWLGRNGFAGSTRPAGFAVRYTATGGSPAVRWRSLVESVPWFRWRLKHVTITCRDGFDILANVPDQPGAAVYCDPPYLDKSFQYLHDFSPADHERLAAAVGWFRRARVVVSYYPHPLLDTLYPATRWRRVAIGVQKKAANAVRGTAAKVDATELLLVNDG